MSKRPRSSRSGPRVEEPSGAGPDQLRSDVENLIARGKTRDAVETARQAWKQTRSPEAEVVLVDAYAARIRALIATGMPREAHELASLVVARHPGTRAHIMPLVHESEACAGGDLGPLLAALAAADDSTRREIETTLRRVLADPRVLANHPALPEGDPLRQAARVVTEVFTAVTTGPLPEGALARLDVISRHSPLAPWKLLVRAIDAYYRRADATVLANLSAIPPDSAPARLMPSLDRLVGRPRSEHPAGASRPATERVTLAERALLDKVSGGRARFGAQLAALIDALRVRDHRRAGSAVRELADAAGNAPAAFRTTFAATMLAHWIQRDLPPRPLLEALTRGRSDVETVRQLALAFERAGAWPAAIPAWEDYLGAAQQVGALPRVGREPCRVLLHMAELIPADTEELLDFVMADDEDDLADMIRHGELPECFDRARLLERARKAHADRAVFRALVAHWEPRDARRAEAAADAWRAHDPRDLEPLLYLARAAERRGDPGTALERLDQAEAIDRLRPDVRRSRFRVLLTSVERRLREGQTDRARDDIERLAVERETAERDRPAYVQALRWAAARCEGDASSATTIERALGEQLANPILLDVLLASIAQSVGLAPARSARPPLGETALKIPKLQGIEGLARAADLLLALDRPLAVPVDLMARIELNPRGASAAHLHSLCTLALRVNRPSLAYAASGAGLELESPLAHRFLLARGRALAEVLSERERARARRCLRAARTLATRLRDTEASREASSALRTLALSAVFAEDEAGHADPTAEEIRRVIEHERGWQMMPRFELEAPRRRRRQRHRRPDRTPPARHRHDVEEPNP
jgi:hypothetical protein